MSLLLLAIAGTAALLTGKAQAATASPGQAPTGVWATARNNGRIEVYVCGSGLCGRILDGDQLRANPGQKDVLNKDQALRSRPVKGLVVFSGYTGGPAEWKGGPVYDPQSGDRSRSGSLKLVGDNELVVKGCIGPLCRTERWKRVK